MDEHCRQKETLLKMRSRRILGREAAGRYAERIRDSWLGLRPHEKRLSLMFVYLQDPLRYTVGMFRIGLAKVRQILSDLID